MERRKKAAFSLAELMITLLILSIVLSAVMPAVTKRNAGQESVWRWLYDGSHGYFGTGSKQEALIGMAVKPILANNDSAGSFDPTNDAMIADYGIRDKNGYLTGEDKLKFSLTDIGDRLLLMKYTFQTKEGSNIRTWHPMSNSHINFFSSSYNGSDETVHYAGRLSLDETNIALGKYTMAKLLGFEAGDGNKKKNNLAVGQFALFGLATGYENVAVGNEALYANGDGYRNVALGFQSLTRNTTGYENNSLGYQTLFYSIAGVGNNAVGHQAGYGFNRGNNNTAIGSFALKLGADDVPAADGNGILEDKLVNNNGNNNTAVGFGSLHKAVEVSDNTAIGILSGGNTSTGDKNLFAGAWSGFYNTTGYNNVMLGYYAGLGDSTESVKGIGFQNVFIGSQTAYSNATGSQSVFIGADAGYSNTTGNRNTIIGQQAGFYNKTGSNNVYIGYKAGFGDPAVTDESNKFAIANGRNLLIGQFPVADDDTESKLESLAYTTNLNSTVVNIGFDLSQPILKVDGSDNTNSVVGFGGKLVGAGGNNIVFGSSIDMDNNSIGNINRVDTKNIRADVYENLPPPTMPSDRRLKNITGEANKGLSTVDAFNIVKFIYKNDETKTEHTGVIAQELQKILPNAVIKSPDGFLAVSISDVMFTIAKAVQELHQTVIDLAKEVKALAVKVTTNSQKIEALEKENAALKQQINDLDARLKKLEAAK